ncbi:MAG TPA: SGNH/GDSL hydrolase family protein [Myxococcota bacterium]|nr:SGNH/GDSL hydrolase family protein [Myxococcota bacterium]
MESIEPTPIDSPAAAGAEPSKGHALALERVARLLLIAFQFGLLVLVVRAFGIESKKFLYVIVYAFAGFLLNQLVPQTRRLAFFALFSLGSFVLVYRASAVWIIGPGLALIALAHVPAPFYARVGLLAAAGAGLAWLRVHPDASPMPSALWPIFGSLFMFRLLMYVYDLKHRRAPFSPAHAIAYFFMLPNACFPMFPLVDYKTFCDAHYKAPELETYQRGLHWCFQGVLHILLYRLIYQNVVVDPATIATAGDAARHIASAYLVYLRFTGSFHLVIGLLYLFGFNLPRVFHFWMLASGFTDLWRRVNIYWKNFIQKLVFYPLHFGLKGKVRPGSVLAIATGLTFVLTWWLHSYQWFWIRGDFPILLKDVVFWSIIGIGVFANLVIEERYGRKRSLRKAKERAGDALRRAAKTVVMFTFMCFAWTLWTAESFEEVFQISAALTNQSWASVLGITGLLAGVGVAAVFLGTKPADPPLRAEPSPGLNPLALLRPAASTLAIAAGMLVLAHHPLLFAFSPKLVSIVDNMRSGNRLSARDSKAMERGYYEDLTNVTRFNDELAEILAEMPPGWNKNPAIQPNPGKFPPFEFRPGASVDYKGARLNINQWGMHDREYTKEKPAGTFRIAVLGSSHTVGIGVDRMRTYENLVEDRLNADYGPAHGVKFEILNFAVSGYGPACGLATFERKILEFSPDAVLVGGMDDITWIVNEMVNASVKSLPIPYPELASVVAAADVSPGTPMALAEQRLTPQARPMLEFVYQRFIELSRAHRVIPLGTVLPRPEDLTERIRTLDAEQAQMMTRAGFRLVDTHDAYAALADPTSLWIRKYDRHPDERGHRLLADALYPSLVEELDRIGVGTAQPAMPGGE